MDFAEKKHADKSNCATFCLVFAKMFGGIFKQHFDNVRWFC